MRIRTPDSTDDVVALTDAPDRLWRKVLRCIDSGKPPSRAAEDALLRDGYRFVRRWGTASEDDVPKLMKKFPALMRAYMYYANPNTMKWLIEASMMTTEPRDVLLKFLGIDDLVYTRYQQFFMDISHKIDTPAYVYTHIIKQIGSGQMVPSDQDYLYKILAYQYGWKVLTEYISFGKLSDETSTLLVEAANSNMVKHYNSATRALVVHQHNALEVIQTYHEAQEAEEAGDVETSKNVVNSLVENLLGSCKMSIIKSTEQVSADEPRIFEPDKGFTIRMNPLPVKRLETQK